MNKPDEPLAAAMPGEKPTWVRYQVLAGMCTLALITYIDRVCISRMQNDIEGDLGFGSYEMGLVFSAFTLGYSLLEVPAGWWGDVVGPRRVLTRIVLCWSVFTALTGLVADIRTPFGIVIPALWLMITVRFLFGAGEAGAFPNIARSFASWFPFRERGFCQGLLWMSGRAGGAIAPVLVGVISSQLTGLQAAVPAFASVPVWRVSFVVFAFLGAGWCLWFYPWYRDTPAEKSTCNEAERRLIETGRPPGGGDGHSHSGVPWGKLLCSANLWTLCAMYFAGAYSWYVYITFLPKYLNQVHGLANDYHETWNLPLLGATSVPAFDVMCGMPLGFGAVGCLLGGPITDRLVRMVGWRWGRTAVGFVSMVGCALLLVAAMHVTGVWPAMLLIAASTFVKDLYMAASWAVCVDIGGKYSGTVSAFMNMTGNLGGVAAPWVIGYMLAQWGPTQQTWAWMFYMFAAVNAIGGVLWLFIDPSKSVVGEHAVESTVDPA